MANACGASKGYRRTTSRRDSEVGGLVLKKCAGQRLCLQECLSGMSKPMSRELVVEVRSCINRRRCRRVGLSAMTPHV